MIPKRHNHSHFWIEDQYLYESYKTIRGLRFMVVMQVPGFSDSHNVDEETIKQIFEKYYGNSTTI